MECPTFSCKFGDILPLLWGTEGAAAVTGLTDARAHLRHQHGAVRTPLFRMQRGGIHMAEFVIVIAAVAGLAATAPVPDAATAATAAPLNAPTAGFRTYPDAASCERAAAALVASAGLRHVCLPVEPPVGTMANAF
jgi:hypothetical protein